MPGSKAAYPPFAIVAEGWNCFQLVLSACGLAQDGGGVFSDTVGLDGEPLDLAAAAFAQALAGKHLGWIA
jgi:hypothetical protein